MYRAGTPALRCRHRAQNTQALGLGPAPAYSRPIEMSDTATTSRSRMLK